MNGMTQAEVAEVMGCSVARVQQIEKSALTKLKRNRKYRVLLEMVRFTPQVEARPKGLRWTA